MKDVKSMAVGWVRQHADFTRRRVAEVLSLLAVARKETGRWQPVMADKDRCMVGPMVAVLLNLLFPGAAQLLTNQVVKGALYLTVYYTLINLAGVSNVSMALAVLICTETWYTVKNIRGGRPVMRLGFFC